MGEVDIQCIPGWVAEISEALAYKRIESCRDEEIESKLYLVEL